MAVSLVPVGVLIWWVEPVAIHEHLQSASLGWLVLTGILLTALTFLMAKCWQIVAAALEIAISYPHAYPGWGCREGAAAALFPLIGASPSAGIAMGIAYGTMMMTTAKPGLYFTMRAAASSAKPSQTHMKTL